MAEAWNLKLSHLDTCIRSKSSSKGIPLVEKRFIKKSAKKKYKLKLSAVFRKIKTLVHGKFSRGFYLIDGVFFPDIEKMRRRGYFAMMVNRFGEIVWIHVPQKGIRNIRKYAVLKPLSQGMYGILFGEKWSYFELFDYKGNILKSVNPRESINPYVIHHDFIFEPKTNSLLTLGNCYYRLSFMIVWIFSVWKPGHITRLAFYSKNSTQYQSDL